MKSYTEKELRSLFQNRSNAYVDCEDVVLAMDEDRFIETVNRIREIELAVSEDSETINVKLALKINKLIHNECKEVPHDIGLRIEEIVRLDKRDNTGS